jgi:hypothetical protein
VPGASWSITKEAEGGAPPVALATEPTAHLRAGDGSDHGHVGCRCHRPDKPPRCAWVPAISPFDHALARSYRSARQWDRDPGGRDASVSSQGTIYQNGGRAEDGSKFWQWIKGMMPKTSHIDSGHAQSGPRSPNGCRRPESRVGDRSKRTFIASKPSRRLGGSRGSATAYSSTGKVSLHVSMRSSPLSSFICGCKS